jgi:hypothetical protein
MSPPKGFIPWNKGKTGVQAWSEESRKKASLSHMGNLSRTGQKRSPEEIAKQSAAMMGKTKSKEARELLSKKLKGRVFTPEWKEKISNAKKGVPNLKTRGKIVSEETRQKLSESMKGHPSKLKGIPKSPEHIEKMRINARNRSPETLLKMSISSLGKNAGEKSHLWKGGSSFEPYCKKFSRIRKEQVRWFFNNKCVYCGNPGNGKKLNVHHVSYDKQVGCNGSPMLLVPLCGNCHSMTNFDREYWEQYFMELLYIQHGGRCSLSIDELKQQMLHTKSEVKV